MTTKPLGTFGRLALFLVPVLIVLAGLGGAIRLLHPRPAVVEALGTVWALIVLGYSLFLGHQHARGRDEVQRAGAGFANSNGWVWGGFAALCLLMLPPVMNRVVDMVLKLPPAGLPDIHLGVRLGLTVGATLVMVMQAVAIVVASLIWRRRMR